MFSPTEKYLIEVDSIWQTLYFIIFPKTYQNKTTKPPLVGLFKNGCSKNFERFQRNYLKIFIFTKSSVLSYDADFAILKTALTVWKTQEAFHRCHIKKLFFFPFSKMQRKITMLSLAFSKVAGLQPISLY